MTEKKPKPLGELIDVKEGGTVVRPDGISVTVTGGGYVLNQTGTYTVDGSEIVVEAPGEGTAG